MDDYIYRPLRLARVRVFKMQSLGYRRGAARDFAELERGVPQIIVLRRGKATPADSGFEVLYGDY